MPSNEAFCDESILWPAGASALYRIPSLARTTEGTVLAFVDRRQGSQSDFGHETDVLCRRSRDGGRTWEAETVIATEPGVCFHGGPALVDRQTGRIFKFYRHVPVAVQSSQMLVDEYDRWVAAGFGSYYRTSDDDGRTWGEPVRLELSHPDAVARLGVGNGLRGAQLSTGRLFVPCFYHHSTTRPPHESRRTFLLYSDDHGATWHNGADGPPEDTCIEVAILATEDDEIYLNHRTRRGRRLVARTTGQGTALAESYFDEALPDPACHASLARYSTAAADGRSRILFCNPAVARDESQPGGMLRRRLTLRLSYDEGRTWPVARLLQPERAAYSDLLTLDDGTILCLYERVPEKGTRDVRLARLNLAWLTEGADPGTA
jgi:sialidase-1